MSFHIWLFPIIFIFHDMEEIIGLIPWLRHNKRELSGYRRWIKPYDGMITEGFASAVFEELILCITISITAYISNFYGLWLGGFIGCMLHFVIHIVESIVIRKYIPGLITSIICLPISSFIIYHCVLILKYSVCKLLFWGLVGIALVACNLRFAHWIMKKVSKYLSSSSSVINIRI